jgi:hypothetical protein
MIKVPRNSEREGGTQNRERMYSRIVRNVEWEECGMGNICRMLGNAEWEKERRIEYAWRMVKNTDREECRIENTVHVEP